MKRIERSVLGSNGSIRTEGNFNVADGASKNGVKKRIKELIDYNDQLEKVIADQRLELSGVIATNNKIISIIAHDLRSPFISILGILEMIRDYFEKKEVCEIEQYINVATDSAHSTLNLLDNLSAWAVSQSDNRSVNPERINLKQLLMEEIRIIKSSAIHKQISLNHSISSDLHLEADVQMIKTVLRNLVNNAVKYSYTGGEVMISASAGKGFVEILVQDNGIGISYEDQRKLFNKEELYSTLGTNNEKGTGLGLLLCKEFVEKHGGKIRLKSEPGKGSRFIITLPKHSL